MFEHRDPSGRRFRTYEVEAASFDLHVGARVAPGQTIGAEVKSGKTIKADDWSFVATAYFNPRNRSYLVMISLTTEGEESRLLEPQLI